MYVWLNMFMKGATIEILFYVNDSEEFVDRIIGSWYQWPYQLIPSLSFSEASFYFRIALYFLQKPRCLKKIWIWCPFSNTFFRPLHMLGVIDISRLAPGWNAKTNNWFWSSHAIYPTNPTWICINSWHVLGYSYFWMFSFHTASSFRRISLHISPPPLSLSKRTRFSEFDPLRLWYK